MWLAVMLIYHQSTLLSIKCQVKTELELHSSTAVVLPVLLKNGRQESGRRWAVPQQHVGPELPDLC